MSRAGNMPAFWSPGGLAITETRHLSSDRSSWFKQECFSLLYSGRVLFEYQTRLLLSQVFRGFTRSLQALAGRVP